MDLEVELISASSKPPGQPAPGGPAWAVGWSQVTSRGLSNLTPSGDPAERLLWDQLAFRVTLTRRGCAVVGSALATCICK